MKRALLVGINHYQDKYIQPLNGCVNDVLGIRAILKEFFGFEDAGIHVLTDERATAARILDRLDGMLYRATDGDVSVFHFSGHGSQIRDRSGDELSDGLDELICPYDMDWNNRESFILDDDLAHIFGEIPIGYHEEPDWRPPMEVILDCCHSGTGVRKIRHKPIGLFDQNIGRQVWGEVQPRYTPPPIDLLCRGMDAKDLPVERLFLNNQYLSEPVLWSACKAGQVAADAFISGEPHGAFTWHLCNAIRSYPPTGLTRFAVLVEVREHLEQAGYEQLPQLETKHTGKLYGGPFS